MSVLTLTLALLPTLVHSHSNGMDMSMDGAMTLSSGQMLPYLHFTTGDILWFMGWVPKSPGAMVGACIGLFLLGVAERLVAAVRGVGERFWRERALVLRAERLRNAEKLPMNSSNSPTRSTPDLKTISSSSKSSSSASIASIEPSPSSTNANAITPLKDAITMRDAPPFILAHDVTRGVLYACQAALQFALMLAVMTYQVGFILSIVIGLGFGEMLFGRFTH